MKTTTRLIPIAAILAAACSQAPSDQGGKAGTPAVSGSAGKPAGGSGGNATAGTGGGGTGGAAKGGTSGTGPSMGGSSGAAMGGTAGGVAGGTSGSGPGGMGGIAPVGGMSGMSGSGATGGDAQGGSAGMAGGTSAGMGGDAGTGPVACPTAPAMPLASADIIQFNDNGGWCWYQDERALVDTKAGKFVIGSVASGGSRDSDQEVVVYDIASGNKQKSTLESDLNPDDHNAPAFFIRPDGGYAALWATHRDTCLSYYSTYDGSAWATHKTYDWTKDGCPWDNDSTHKITYANPWYLSAEDKAYAGVRSVNTSPALLTSTDAGSSWNFYGRLTQTPTVGYVAGYFKYWGNGVDRIDFVGTDAHPRDSDNSLYHGYYKGGKLYSSKDAVVDDMAGDTTAKNIDQFTQVFKTGTAIKSGVSLCRMWNHDIMRYPDGTIVITGQGRVDHCADTPSDSDPDKRLMYARWDGTSWKSTYLVKAGPKLYADEQDYTGLSAIHPDNPNVIFVSSNYDPRDDTTKTSKKELYMGITCDKGATFTWAPLTSGSTVDNIRPIVPKWDSTHTLLLWMKGTYTSAQSYSMQIVGTTALLK